MSITTAYPIDALPSVGRCRLDGEPWRDGGTCSSRPAGNYYTKDNRYTIV